MGLLKGSLTFSRYRVKGELPAEFRPFFDRQIKKYAFRDLTASAEEQAFGWTCLENPLDTAFEGGRYCAGDFFYFSLRLDRKSVPPALLRLKCLEEERKSLKDSGRTRLFREQAREIKERVFLHLLTKAHPVPSFYDVCWSVPGGWLLVGSHADRVFEIFEDLFKITFNARLTACLPWDPEHLDRKTAAALTVLGGGSFLEPARGSAEKTDPALLAREFMTWLWFKSEERDGTVSLPGQVDVRLTFEKRVVLESGEGEYSETVSCQGLHADLREGKAAIREGKKVREARLRLERDSDRWEFTLKADRFQFQSMKLPQTGGLDEEGVENEGGILERIGLVETGLRTMDDLFAFFLKRRLSSQWAAEEIPRVKAWLKG
ncbi:MAG: recombination-associated protein RdgC [Pseudomonadota bacterium]|jgi:recombination associated protein RdgC|nr:recombination-associated protein RdgC [Syntrophobacterales bacterium]MDI9555640.1 recombination-associated protein RdgC [Pseudomonadota bacterium]NLX32026.1 recombination-associated protein RdgC [Deltaproteobacteria bacterium]HNU84422.1 recombination-associated protein RdgC [Syntrophales bacterium]HNZ34354.1 recombination-associated protein RdgC [Syntrophales bacterium]